MLPVITITDFDTENIKKIRIEPLALSMSHLFLLRQMISVAFYTAPLEGIKQRNV